MMGVYVVNINLLRVLLDCGTILWIGKTLVAETSKFAREICHMTFCTAARDFLLPNFYKNSVVLGEKFASN